MKKTDLRYVEKPDPKRPQLWMGYWENTHDHPDDRFRILYPSGKTEWAYVLGLKSGDCWGAVPCWNRRWRMRSFKDRVHLMKKYDKSCGRKTMFLGNI